MGWLKIDFKTKKLRRECLEYKVSLREHGKDMAYKIAQRISELEAAESVEMLVKFSIGRCHPLKGNRNGEYSMDLVHPYRLVFEYKNDVLKLVKIIAIEDYH